MSVMRKSSRGNPNHWPKGHPKGGQFAPKGQGFAVNNSEKFYNAKTLLRQELISEREFREMTQNNTPKTIEYKECKTVKEAEEYCRNLGVEPYYKGLDLNTCNAINKSVAYTLEYFPKTRNLLRVCGNAQEINKAKKKDAENCIMESIKADWPVHREMSEYDLEWNRKRAKKIASRLTGRVSQGVMAYTYMQESTNPKYGHIENKYLGIYVNSNSNLGNGAAYGAESGYHPEGCITAKSIIDHECGHLIHATYGGIKVNMREPRIKYELSEYASKNVKEYHAEAWAEFLNNPNPRPRAKEIGEEFMRRRES